MYSTRVAVACAILLLKRLVASAAPVEVVLQVDPQFDLSPGVVMTAYGDLGLQEFREQIPDSLQSVISGNLRVRFDPANPNSIEFLADGSHLDLSNTSLVVLPGFAPANFAGVTTGGIMFAIRDASFELSSGPLTMTPDGTSHRFPSSDIAASFIQGTYRSTSSPTFDILRFASLAGNSFGIDGLFTWYPNTPGDNMLVTVPIQYRYQPSGPASSDQINFVSQVRLFASFSLDNVADVGLAGGAVEVLGGASAPGGVSATIGGVTEPGSFTAQRLGLAGLSRDALEQALTVPDLAYTLSIAGYTNPDFSTNPTWYTNPSWYTNPIWDMDFTGVASTFEVTLGYAEHTNPIWIEDRLVLYHYNHLGAWEKVAGQILDTEANTIKHTNPEFSPFMLAVTVPEPSSVLLAALGLVGLVFCCRVKTGRCRG